MKKNFENDFYNFYKKRKNKVKEFQINVDLDNDENIEKYQNKPNRYSKINFESKDKNAVKFFKHIWISMIILVSFSLSQYSILALYDMFAINCKKEEIIVNIPQNFKSNDISKTLYENGIIKNKNFFNTYIKIKGSYKKFHSGSFKLRTDMDYQAIKNCLMSNKNRLETDIINILIPEGKNILEIAAILEKNNICNSKEFLNVCNSNQFEEKYEFLKNIENKEKRVYKLEGYLFPDTYKFYKYSKPDFVIKKILLNYNKKIHKKTLIKGSDKKTNIITRITDSKMSIDSVINLASLIQAEAANIEDMYNVSSVIHNRLNTMKTGDISPVENAVVSFLGIDSTIWYPYRNKDKIPTETIEKFEKLYDTYKFKGLPLGPICNPGTEAINAALNPNKTPFFYFCHSKDGKSYYAKTNSEHRINMKKAGLI